MVLQVLSNTFLEGTDADLEVLGGDFGALRFPAPFDLDSDLQLSRDFIQHDKRSQIYHLLLLRRLNALGGLLDFDLFSRLAN
jgi:hypothetical protein